MSGVHVPMRCPADQKEEALHYVRPLRDTGLCPGPAGIAAFNRLVDGASGEGLWTRLKEMQQRYYLRCPGCGYHFWIEPGLAKTSLFDGSLQGFRCPVKNCREVVPWRTKE